MPSPPVTSVNPQLGRRGSVEPANSTAPQSGARPIDLGRSDSVTSEQFYNFSKKQEADEQPAENDPDEKHEHRNDKNPVAPARNGTRSGGVVPDDLIIARV